MTKEYKEKQTNETKATEPEVEINTDSISSIDEDAFDDLLDEIDDVLEENAQAFVEGFVQKGGE